MSTMKAIQVKKAGGELELVELPIPAPGAGEVLIKVEACGICHSDALAKDGLVPVAYPRVPGHEVVGRVQALGGEVSDTWRDKRVGVGWHGGHCFRCEPCRRGDFINCRNAKVTGLSFDGGYAEYMVAPQEALALVPDDFESADAAPLLCAGITTYNGLRHSGALPGDVVAIQGIGGLGHLALQFSHRMGFRTVALSYGPEKRELATALGAHHYVDTSVQNEAEALNALGGARVVLATAPNSKLISGVVDGLGVNGQLVVVAAAVEPMQVSPLQLIVNRRSIQGWPSGHAKDSEDTLAFSALTGIRPRIEVFPLEQAAQAYRRMITNQARFRVVLTPG